MTPDEFKALRARLSLTQDQLGALIGVTKHAITKWELGHRPVPKTVVLLLEQQGHIERKK